MNKPAAIAANLVDVRNLDAHKCVKLTIHVPAEQAPLVLEAFGWPTAVDPVPVAIARLAPAKPAHEPRSRPAEASASKERKPFKSLPLPQQAAMRCQEPEFERFIFEKYHGAGDGDAAHAVRELCGVTSRSQIREDDPSGRAWRIIDQEYLDWKHAPSSYEGVSTR